MTLVELVVDIEIVQMQMIIIVVNHVKIQVLLLFMILMKHIVQIIHNVHKQKNI